MIILVFSLIAASVFLVFFGIFYKPAKYLHLRDKDYSVDKLAFFKEEERHPLSDFFKRMKHISRPVYEKMPYLRRLNDQTEILRISFDVYTLIIIKFILGLGAGFLSLAFFPADIKLYSLLVMFMAFFAPDIIITQKIKVKKEAIGKCFPETVDLLDMCVSAGADLVSAIKWVIDKSNPNPFIEQLGIVLGEIRVGKSRSVALKDMSARLQLPDVASFSRAIVQAERMGTSVEEAFRNLSDDTRNRRYQAGERYAIKASLKILFPLIFCILPAIMIVVAGPIIIKFSSGELVPRVAY